MPMMVTPARDKMVMIFATMAKGIAHAHTNFSLEANRDVRAATMTGVVVHKRTERGCWTR